MKSNFTEPLLEFFERERNEVAKAVKEEKKQVCIKADSYIAKEIKYQTVLLHRILEELRRIDKT